MARDISSFTKRMANQGFKWPRNQSEVRQITKQQLTWLLDGLSVSDTTVSRITDKILPVAKEWQQRPVESIYAVVFLDAIHYHVRSEGQIVKKAVYITIGLDLDGRKDVLGMWVGENESAKFWATVLNGLRNRGVENIFIACTDNLTGFDTAIHANFP